MAATSAQSQVFAEKVNVDQQATPINHVVLGVGLLLLVVIGIGVVNHHADR